MENSHNPERYDILDVPKRKKIWDEREELAMLQFMFLKKEWLENHMSECIRKKGRKNKNNFFKQMETYIGTKTDSQCKSRFQKVEKKLLEKIGIDSTLLEQYLLSKKQRKPLSEIQKNTNAVERMSKKIKKKKVQIGALKEHKITSYIQLKTMIDKLIIPFIKDKDIQEKMMVFALEMERMKEGDELRCFLPYYEKDQFNDHVKLFNDENEVLFFSE